MADEYSQYNTEDDDTVISDPTKISVVKLPIVTELKIGNQTISVINPEYVDKLQKRVIALEKHLVNLDNEIKKIKASSRARDAVNPPRRGRSNDDYD